MWRQKIGISVGNHYDMPTEQLVSVLKNIGFDGVSPEWEKDVDISKVIAAARESGLEIISLHAPFSKMNWMWQRPLGEEEYPLDGLLASLKVCYQEKIPTLVVHTWIGFEYEDQPNQIGLENFGKLVDQAKEWGINIAFENTEGEEFLAALMDHFKGYENVGFCWDSGHELCYNHSEDLLGKFGRRLMVTHLNDNLGISRFDGETFWHDDLHLLPYDGIADWEENISRLKASRPLEFLNFELIINSKPNRHDNDIYQKLSLEEYFTEAYKRACRIAYRYSR